MIGNANVDVTTYVPHTPGPGATVLGTDFSVGMGGKRANQAVAASRAGGYVALVGRVGTDSFGEMMLETLGREELDLSSLNQVPGPSGVGTIWVEKGKSYCRFCWRISKPDGGRGSSPSCWFSSSAHRRQPTGNTPGSYRRISLCRPRQRDDNNPQHSTVFSP